MAPLRPSDTPPANPVGPATPQSIAGLSEYAACSVVVPGSRRQSQIGWMSVYSLPRCWIRFTPSARWRFCRPSPLPLSGSSVRVEEIFTVAEKPARWCEVKSEFQKWRWPTSASADDAVPDVFAAFSRSRIVVSSAAR